ILLGNGVVPQSSGNIVNLIFLHLYSIKYQTILGLIGVYQGAGSLNQNEQLVRLVVALQAVDTGYIVGRLPVLNSNGPLFIFKYPMHTLAGKLIIQNFHFLIPPSLS